MSKTINFHSGWLRTSIFAGLVSGVMFILSSVKEKQIENNPLDENTRSELYGQYYKECARQSIIRGADSPVVVDQVLKDDYDGKVNFHVSAAVITSCAQENLGNRIEEFNRSAQHSKTNRNMGFGALGLSGIFLVTSLAVGRKEDDDITFEVSEDTAPDLT